MIEVRIVANAATGGSMLADEIFGLISAGPEAVLGVATGSSPEFVYQSLAEKLRTKPVDVSRVKAFALDEYVGIDYGVPQSYHTYIQQHVTEPLGLDPQFVYVPEGTGEPGVKITEYDDGIATAGGIDLQILGIGHNAHIGFNEPGTSFDMPTHIERLEMSTREANSRFFGSIHEVPTLSVTQGPATIMRARRIVLLAFGEGKAQAVADAVRGGVTEQVPASILQRHRNVSFIVDEAAASLLSER